MRTVSIHYTQTLETTFELDVPDDVDMEEWIDIHRDDWESRADTDLELVSADYEIIGDGETA